MFSNRIRNVSPSGTVMLSNKVKKLQAQGQDILSFTLGEPDFSTPEHIVAAAKKALDEGHTHYVQSTGMPELKEAVSEHVRRKNGLDAGPENVMIMPTKFALYSALQTFVDPGDEVIFPNPGWVSYDPMISLANGTPVPVRMRYDDEGWYWDPGDIRSSITRRTKAIILNTPSNPTGSIIGRETLGEIADIAKERDLVVISDEAYENLVYGEEHVSIGSLDSMRDRVVTISGFSKSYAMTGWRIGWMVAAEETIQMVNKLQQHSLTCVPPFVQIGALAALRGGDECTNRMRDEFKGRRDMLVPLLNEIPAVRCELPKGAFYAFFKMNIGIGSSELAEMMLTRAHVALTPGSAFGSAGEGFMRMSYAASTEDLKEGVDRIWRFVSSIRNKG